MRTHIYLLIVISLILLLQIDALPKVHSDSLQADSEVVISIYPHLSYSAYNTVSPKDGVMGVLILHDVDFPDPPLLSFDGVWTHIALKPTATSQSIVEIGIRKLKYNWLFIFIFTEKSIYITYWNPQLQKTESIVLTGNIPLQTPYYVRIVKLSNNVWLLGAYAPSYNITAAIGREFPGAQTTYYAFSQVEFKPPANTIYGPSGRYVANDYLLRWENINGYFWYNGIAQLYGNVNIYYGYNYHSYWCRKI